MQYLIKKIDLDKAKIREENNFFTVAGYATTWGNPDGFGDIIDKDAEMTINANSVLLFQHETHNPIGTISGITKDDKGVFIESKINTNLAKGKEAKELIVSDIVKSFSMGFRLPKDGFYYDSQNRRHITKFELMEVSIVTFPANEMAKITDFKERKMQDTNQTDFATASIFAAAKDTAEYAKKAMQAAEKAEKFYNETDGVLLRIQQKEKAAIHTNEQKMDIDFDNHKPGIQKPILMPNFVKEIADFDRTNTLKIDGIELQDIFVIYRPKLFWHSIVENVNDMYGETMEELQINGLPFAAAVVEEGQQKPQININRARITKTLKTIAQWADLTEQEWEDYFANLREVEELFAIDASQNPFYMEMAWAKIQSNQRLLRTYKFLRNLYRNFFYKVEEFLTAETYGLNQFDYDPNQYDLISAIELSASDIIDNSGLIPNAVLVNTKTLAKMRVMKDDIGHYLLNFADERLWRLEVIANPLFQQDKIVVGAFNDAFKIKYKDKKGQSALQIAPQNKDNFVKNLLTIRNELRANSFVLNTAAFTTIQIPTQPSDTPSDTPTD